MILDTEPSIPYQNKKASYEDEKQSDLSWLYTFDLSFFREDFLNIDFLRSTSEIMEATCYRTCFLEPYFLEPYFWEMQWWISGGDLRII